MYIVPLGFFGVFGLAAYASDISAWLALAVFFVGMTVLIGTAGWHANRTFK